jgi:hypothetical protein
LLKQNNILKMEDIIKHQGIIEKTFIWRQCENIET